MKLATAQISGFLNSPPASVRVFLFYGPDAGLVHERAEAMASKLVRDKNDPFAVSAFPGSTFGDTPSRLLDEMAAIPFGGGRRLVRIHQTLEALSAALADFIKSPPPGDSVVILEGGDLDKRSKLRALCEGASDLVAAIPCYLEDASQRAKTITTILEAEGIHASRDIVRMLADILPPDRMALRSEMDKLALYARGQKDVTMEDVRAVIADAGGADVEDLVQAAVNGEAARAMALLDRLFAEQTSSVFILRALQRHLIRLQLARSYMEEGASADAAIKRLSPPVFWKQVDPMKRQLQRWTPEKLEKRLADLLEAEAAVKRTGTPETALTAQLVLSMAAR